VVRFTNSFHGQQYDAAQTRLREILTDLEGVSDETLEQIEKISRPSGDGPAPHDDSIVVLYERLVLQALAENAWAKQQQTSSATKGTKARKAS
jgi:hypothetical protein